MSSLRPIQPARVRVEAADATERRAHAPWFWLAAAATATLFAAAPARAQVATPAAARATTLSITPYAGYLVTGHLFDGPLSTSLSSASGAMYGAQAAIPLTPNISALGNLGYSSGDLRLGIPIIGGVSVGTVKTLLYDAGLELRAPGALGATKAISPFVQAGVGGVRYDVSVSSLSRQATSLAWNAGVGADLSLGQGIGVRLLAKDYVGKFDVQEATGLNIQGSNANNWALTAGLTLSF